MNTITSDPLPVLVELDVEPPLGARGFEMAPALPSRMPKLPQLAALDEAFGTIPLRGLALMAAAPVRETSLVRGFLPLSEVSALRREKHVRAVWSDPRVYKFPPVPVDCDFTTPNGTKSDVIRLLGADRLWEAGHTGSGIVIGIVDGGVDRERYPVDGGWTPDPAFPPGVASHWDEHGNMCAFDALIAAPEARLYDLGIGKTPGDMSAFLSAALQAFQWALNRFENVDGTPHVLSNSWGLYQDSWDPFPPGDPGNYTHNPQHPFTRKVLETIDAGILVAFAAGNCGGDCVPGDQRCGKDVGPGRSIRGANGHERVICVGAVNVDEDRVGYSSQGPSTLAAQKPDICGYTHFEGHFSPDAGTSAACPVVAGVLAALRSAKPSLRQDDARKILTATAVKHGPGSWDRDMGYGIVHAEQAYKAL